MRNLIMRRFKDMFQIYASQAKVFPAWFVHSRLNNIFISVCVFGLIGVEVWVLKKDFAQPKELVTALARLTFLLLGIVWMEFNAFVAYHIVKDVGKREFKEDYLSKLEEKDFHDDERREELRSDKEEHDFKRNLESTIVLQSLNISEVQFFDNFQWKFSPSINVLLGKNGYGKTHLLRAIVSLLYKDKKQSDVFFGDRRGTGQFSLSLTRDGESEEILRSDRFFEKSIGKVPLLAIPDARFINKSETTIKLIDEKKVELKDNGGYHFLYQQPYEGIVQTFLYQLCIEYLDRGKRFDATIFDLVSDVINKLTDQGFVFKRIEPIGSAKFRVEVLTEGNEDNPLPIQYASQGTLSVLAIFGLIHNYLRSIFPDVDDRKLLDKPGIVFIDEIDAHLHPSWQQKIIGLLRNSFKNVQFIVTAHSPLIAAGCYENEVAVMTKTTNGFSVKPVEEDLIGSRVSELYERLFQIGDEDEIYNRYLEDLSMGKDPSKQRSELESKRSLSDAEEKELDELYEAQRYVDRVTEKMRGRESKNYEIRIAKLEAQIRELKHQLDRRSKS